MWVRPSEFVLVSPGQVVCVDVKLSQQAELIIWSVPILVGFNIDKADFWKQGKSVPYLYQ
jgi:hypothetical protein